MQKIITDLSETIEKYHVLLQQVNDDDLSAKPQPNKWSKKEELGHLIDSAQNNIQRFIRAQYEENVHVIYDADNWVDFNDYQNKEKNDVIKLWFLLNKQIVTILEKMPIDKYEILMSFDENASVKNIVLFIAEDYVDHMMHHLVSILDIKKPT